MDINLFDFDLPAELIAQYPSRSRDESKLLVLDRKTGQSQIKIFKDIYDYLKPGDCLVVNNTRVFKARLIGNRVSGGEAEIFLIRRIEKKSLVWEALARPSRRLKENELVYFHKQCHNERLSLTLKEDLNNGRWHVEFNSVLSEEKIIDKYGHIPLPQYIKRADVLDDVSRYQTIFARQDQTGAVAAPTAGFHFTDEVVSKLKAKGVMFAEVTLHVGPGTFKPVTVDDINNHSVEPEYASLPKKTADIINQTRKNGGDVIAVGTTSVRTLESAEIINNEIQPFEKFVDLYIKPGFEFKTVDHLITNYHLPKSSLLILVSAFAGREQILSAYKKAVENKFRFYSYGDAMLIL